MLNRNHRSLIHLGILLAAVLLVTDSALAGFLMGTNRVFPSGEDVIDFAVGDLDGDGIPDIGVVSGWTRLLQVRFGLGDGAFGEVSAYDLDSDAQLVRCGDMDNDGDNDLVLFSTGDNGYSDNYITVYSNDGSGQLSPDWRLTMPSEDYDIVDGLLADFNHDDHLDLAIINDHIAKIIVFFGAGDGTLTENARYQPGVSLYSILDRDLDGDGNVDLALAGSGDFTEEGSIQILYGLPDGTFEPAVQHLTFQRLFQVDAGDLDGDGDLDLAGAGDSEGDGALSVFLSRGNRTFQDPLYYHETFNYLQGVALEERTGDGVLDAILWGSHEWGKDDIYILPGQGDGTFGDAVTFRLGNYLGRTELVDLDGNGGNDLVGIDQYTSYQPSVIVLMSRGLGGFVSPWRITLGEERERDPHNSRPTDFNNDGIPDLVIETWSYGVYTLIGNGDGSFQPAVSHLFPSSCSGVGAADVDRDSNTDLLATCTIDSNSSLCIYPGNGDGTFGDLVTTDLGQFAGILELAHFDGDTFIDILTWTGEGCQVFHGDGAGGFTAGQTALFTAGNSGVNPGDMDGDGDLDLAMVFDHPDSILIALNNGSGVFSDNGSYTVGGYPIDLTLGDFNGDGYLDLATANQTDLDGTLYFGNGDGTLTAGPDFSIGINPWEVEAADMDGDGLDDLVIGTYPNWEDPSAFCLLRSSGSGFSGLHEMYGAGSQPYYVNIFDADSDGDPDIAVTNSESDDNLWMILNSSGGPFFAAGPGAVESNPSEVRTFAPAGGNLRDSWTAYNANRWGVNVALGELTGSGTPEVLTGAGPGAVFGPHVRGFDSSGTPLPGVSYLAYGTNKYGVNVAAGDIDNDGFDEIITGAGPGAVFGPHVRGWNWDGAGVPQPIAGISYFAYGTPKWGVNVSCGDIDGDGFDEIVTGAGPGAVYGPHVRGWNCDGSGATAISAVSFLAYGTNKYGVNVCCGDIDGDGIDEMVTGAGPGEVFGPHVRAWNWDGTGVVQAIPGVSFFAYNDYSQWGVNVSCGDLDNDGIDEILTGPGPGAAHAPRVRGWNYDGLSLTAMSGVDIMAFDQAIVTHGVKVAGAR